MNIIVDSTFNPFSYKDLMLPAYDYKLAYEETEAAYSDLVTQTEAWKDIANRENSPEAYAMYKSYADLLNAIVDDFSQGMNPRNRGLLLGMKRRYASEITPIAKASEAMQAANTLRDLAGPDAIFEEGRYSSIDRFLHGQTANNRFESRKDIVSRTAALVQATALSILEDPIIKQSMSPQFLEVIQRRGLGSLDELQAAIAGNPEAANRFALIKSLMIDLMGGLDRFDDEGRAAVEGAINEGLYTGLNNYLISLQRNGEYMTRAQRVSAAQKIVGGLTKIGTGGTGRTSTSATDIDTLNKEDRAARLKAVSKPLYFNAGGLQGNAQHRDLILTQWEGASDEGYEHTFDLLQGKAKTRALNYIGNLVGLLDYAETYSKLPPEVRLIVDNTLNQYVKVWRDQDWFSDNHFAVYLVGADHLDPSNYNETDIIASLKAILTAIGGTGNYDDVVPGDKKE